MTLAAALYVYYKVEPAQHAALAPRVRRFQADLSARWPGLTADLMQRPEVTNGMETWMEIYRHARGLTPELVAAIGQAALDAALPEPRHTERFIALT